MRALDMALEVALMVEGLLALISLVENDFVHRDVPYEQRLAGSLFSTVGTFEEGFCL